MNDYKLNKYQVKLASTNDQNKINTYNAKLDFYSNPVLSLVGQSLPLVGGKKVSGVLSLATPHKPYPASEYDVEPDIDRKNINARGYGLLKKHTDLEPVVFERRQPYLTDVVIKINYAGVCHSDWHSITGEWESSIPLVPGHEISGTVVKIGPKVTKFAIGDLVAVGPYVNSCRVCDMCKHGHEQYCENGVSSTYDSTDRQPGDIVATGEPTYGGYSNIITVNQDFVFMIPNNIKLECAAPLLCAGITTYSPLSQSLNQSITKKGMKVGVAGIGGLGHMTVKLAKAMGAYVVALTRTEWKLEDSISNLGADESILVTDEKQMKTIVGTLDLIIDTIPKKHDLDMYLELLAYNGTLWVLGPFTELEYDMGFLADKNRSLKSSIIGGVPDIKEMLKFCSKNNIEPDIEIIPLGDINKTHKRILNSNIKYRFVIDMNL